MEKGKVLLVVSITILIIGIIFTLFEGSNYSHLTGSTINGKDISVQSATPYLVASIFLFLVAIYLIKLFFFPQIRLFSLIAGMKPDEALDALILEFEVAINRGDIQRANSIANRINHLYEHLPDSKQKRSYKLKIRHMEKFIKTRVD